MVRDDRNILPFWRAVFAILSVGGAVLSRHHHPIAGFAFQILATLCLVPTVQAVNRLNGADVIVLHPIPALTAGVSPGRWRTLFSL